MENPDILDEGLHPRDIELIPAGKGKRLANFLVDYVAIFIFVTILLLASGLDVESEETDRLMQGLIFLAYLLDYLFFEYLTGGKSVGKYLTRTRVIRQDGTQPRFGQLLGRSLARLIPFELFSFLSRSTEGWHDSLSRTMVIDERRSTLPRGDRWV